MSTNFDTLKATYSVQVQDLLKEPLDNLTKGRPPAQEVINGLRAFLEPNNNNLTPVNNSILKERFESLREYDKDADEYIPEKLRNGDKLTSAQREELEKIFHDTFKTCIQDKLDTLKKEPQVQPCESSAKKRPASPVEEPKRAAPAKPVDATDLALYGMPLEDISKIILDASVDQPEFLMTLGRFGILQDDPEMLVDLQVLANLLGEYKQKALSQYRGRPFEVSAINFIDNKDHVARLEELYTATKEEENPPFKELIEGWGTLVQQVLNACEMAQFLPPDEANADGVTLRDKLQQIYTAYSGNVTELPRNFNPPDLSK